MEKWCDHKQLNFSHSSEYFEDLLQENEDYMLTHCSLQNTIQPNSKDVAFNTNFDIAKSNYSINSPDLNTICMNLEDKSK